MKDKITQQMTLTEFREAIDSESKKENEKLKKELKLLNEKYTAEAKKNKKTIDRLQSIVNALSERCYAIFGLPSGESMCSYCELTKEECKHAISSDKKVKFTEKEYKNGKKDLK